MVDALACTGEWPQLCLWETLACAGERWDGLNLTTLNPKP